MNRSPVLPYIFASIAATTALALIGCGEQEASTAAPTSTASSTSAPATINTSAPAPQAKPEPKAPDNPRLADSIEAPAGFQAELIYDIPKEQGSWVAVCNGPDGTLYATDQYGSLYQVTPPPVGDYETETIVKQHPVKLNGAQGLCYHRGTLYMMETGKGVVKAIDSDDDGAFDQSELLLAVKGGGEHGTHAIVPAPDGETLFIVSGNMTPVPQTADSRPAEVWDEDQLLKREPDARGHASRVMAPGGWIGEMNLDGSNLILHCHGFRNAYDIDFDSNGELFAYDSDMEWDLGLPWYRPTRVNHAVSGAEFGWRNGSGKWPAYYPESLGSVVDIGPGSPTGVFFGYGAKFPTKYQSALYIMDWTYGIMYAVHLSPDGATYSGELEPFLVGKPLPLTDGVIGEDGNMYFAVGGRRIKSAFYRVYYYGNKDTAEPEPQPLTDLAKLRRDLEEYHTNDAPAEAIEALWPNLAHEDRFIRFAARVALEHQPVERYLEKAQGEEDPAARSAIALAWSRVAPEKVLSYLNPVDPTKLDAEMKLTYLRAIQVALARGAGSDQSKLEKVLPYIETMATAEDERIAAEAIRLMVYLKPAESIQLVLNRIESLGEPQPPVWAHLAAQNDRYGAAIQEMTEYPPPTQAMGYAFMLRDIKEGWTIDQRREYFEWLNKAEAGGGGLSYKGYLDKIRGQSVATLSQAEKDELGGLINKPTVVRAWPTVQPTGPAKQWTLETATAAIDGKLNGRNFDRGAGLFMAQCANCHVMNNIGAAIGPDLTSLPNKYAAADMINAIINPNADVSEQYAMQMVTKNDGSPVMGWVVEANDDMIKLKPNVLQDTVVEIKRSDVKSITEIPTSSMPVGLINPMNEEELRDLIAFLLSGGNKDHEVFKK